MAKKRSNGEGTLRQRPNGIWELTIMDAQLLAFAPGKEQAAGVWEP